MPLDPQAVAFLEHEAALGRPAIWQAGPELSRRLYEEGTPLVTRPPEEVASVRDEDAGGVPVRVYTPAAALAAGGTAGPATLVYLHGGGWVIGSLDSHDGLCRSLAARAGCRVVSVAYRTAPEHRFPAALEDAWTATRWAEARSSRLAVGGDSSGGNLAAAVALRARDAGPRLELQLLIYPVLDCDLDRPSYLACADGYSLTRRAMDWYWEAYLGSGDRAQPEASPLRAPTLAGVAPALVAVCEFDPLRDEGATYAARLREAGVEARLVEYEGMIHGFLRLTAVFDRAQELLDLAAGSLRQAFDPR